MATLAEIGIQKQSVQNILFLEIFKFKTCQSDSSMKIAQKIF